MCGCGRRKTQVTTSVQAAQEAEVARQALTQLETQVTTEAERLLISSAKAARNSHSHR